MNILPEPVLEYAAFALFFIVGLAAISWWLRRTGHGGRLVGLAWAFLLVSLVPGWFLTQASEAGETVRLSRAIKGFAPTYAAELEAMGHEQITVDTPANDPLYVAMIQKQIRWLKLNPHVADIYTFRKHPEGNQLIVDSETDYDGDGAIDDREGSREVRSAIGTLWEESGPLLEQAFGGEAAFDGTPYTDFWGSWVSAYVPLRDETGAVDAVLGVDYDAAEWTAAMRRARWLALGALAVFLLSVLSLVTVIAVLRANLLERNRAASRTRKVIDQAHDAFVAMDERSVITDWNPQSTDVFGWTREEALGKDLPELLMPERYRGLHRGAVDRYIKTGVSHVVGQRIDVTGHHKDGREIQLEMTIAAIKEGGTHRFHAFLHDISERVEREAQLLAAKDDAEAATRAKTEFIASVSHEIRTPLNGILGMSELLGTTPLNEKQRGYLAQVRRSSDNLLHLLNDVLDMSKIEAGKIDLEVRPFDLRAAVTAVTQSVRPLAERKGLSLDVRVDDAVPAVIRGDPGRLGQVLANLLSNALKFTSEGGIRVAIEVESEPADGVQLHFSVSDSGIGISTEKQESIFDAFNQEDASTTRRYGGTGLGLSICRHLVTRMGGRIAVKSDPGRGATFSFTAHFEHADAADLDPQAAAALGDVPAGGEAPAPLRPLRILLAEDGKVNQEVAVGLLELDGHRVDVVENGALALEAVGGGVYDVVLMDLQMPVMDGIGATRAIRAREPETDTYTPIVALTAIAMKGDRERCLRAGMDAYLSKPIDRAELRETLRGVVGRRRPRPAAAEASPDAAVTTVDWAVAAERIPGGDVGVRKLATLMEEEAPRLLTEVRAAVEAADATRVGLAAHTLRGSAQYFGAQDVVGVAGEAEALAQVEDLAGLRTLLPKLETAVAGFLRSLEASSPGSPPT